MSDRPRPGKARKQARVAIKQARRLLKQYGPKVDEAHRAEVKAAIEALHAAVGRPMAADDYVERVQAAEADVSKVVDARLGHVRKSPTREYLESIGFAIVIALLLRAFIIEAFTIPSGSMIPTLAVGDFLFVNKLSYGVRLPFVDEMMIEWSAPERGDVVVFVYPCNETQDYIKRVVGVPGDEVFVDPLQGFVWVNGEQASEKPLGQFTALDRYGPDQTGMYAAAGVLTEYLASFPGQNFSTLHYGVPRPGQGAPPNPASDWNGVPDFRACRGGQEDPSRAPRMPWVVPEGHVFVMGDNRGNSADSRLWGFVPYGSIKGKAMFIWMSWDGTKSFTRPWEKIRWSRLFQGVHAEPESSAGPGAGEADAPAQ